MHRPDIALAQLAAALNKGVEAVDEALDKIAEQLATSLANKPQAFDKLLTYGANCAGIQIAP